MPGPCCMYCGRHCFVLRELPADAKRWAGHRIHLATCRAGRLRDSESLGYDVDTAINPSLEGEQ